MTEWVVYDYWSRVKQPPRGVDARSVTYDCGYYRFQTTVPMSTMPAQSTTTGAHELWLDVASSTGSDEEDGWTRPYPEGRDIEEANPHLNCEPKDERRWCLLPGFKWMEFISTFFDKLWQ